MNIDKDSTWEEMTIGGTVCDSGNSVNYKTGDWRNVSNVVFVFLFVQRMLFLLEKI